MDLRWAGAVRRKTSESGGLVTSVNVGTGVARSALSPEGGIAGRVRGSLPSAFADGGVRAEVRRMGEPPDPRVSPFGRFRL